MAVNNPNVNFLESLLDNASKHIVIFWVATWYLNGFRESNDKNSINAFIPNFGASYVSSNFFFFFNKGFVFVIVICVLTCPGPTILVFRKIEGKNKELNH